MCAMAFDVTLTELASLSSRLITFEGPYLSNTVDGTLKKTLCRCICSNTHTHSSAWFIQMPWVEGALNGSGLPDGELERPSRNRWAEDGGVLGMREQREGKKRESIDSQGPPSLLPTPDCTYHQPPACPHPTKFIFSTVILRCNESAICTHM